MSRRVHRDDVRRFGIGVVTVVIGSTIAWVGVTVQGGGELPLKSYTVVRADFADLGTLKPEQKVTEAGVRVGQVTGIRVKGDHAEVTMRLEGRHPVYKDATARVGNESALGKKFIDLDPGTKAAGDLGDASIPVAQTTSASSLDDVFAPFGPDARAGLQTGLQQLGGGFAGHGTDVRDVLGHAPKLLADAQTVLGTLSDPATNVDDLLRTSDSLVRQFDGQSQRLGALLEESTITLHAVNVDRTDPLRRTLQQLPDVLATARTGLAAVQKPLDRTASAVGTLRPGVDDLVAAVPDARGFLTESPPVARTVVRFTGQAEPALKALVPAVADLRPVVDRLQRTLILADPLLQTLAPYAPDMGGMVANHDLLSGKFSPTEHYFSAQVAFPGIYNVSLPDPLAQKRPYPGPGVALRPAR